MLTARHKDATKAMRTTSGAANPVYPMTITRPPTTALGEEARNARRSIPASTIGIVIVTGLFYLLVVCAETFGVGWHDILSLTRQHSSLALP